MGSCRAWLTRRHSFPAEAALVICVYLVYEATRGLVVGSAAEAVAHAREIAHVERSLQMFAERGVQQAAAGIPGLLGVLGTAYLALHLTVAAGFLLWLHRRRARAFAYFRNTLLLSTLLAVAVFVAYPTAPPRLAGIGIADTVSNGRVDLNTGVVHSLYNPFAAIPSMHFGYAVVIGVGVAVLARSAVVRVVAALYPVFVLFVIVATGNHFLLDAVAGALTAGVAALAAWWLQGWRRRDADEPASVPRRVDPVARDHIGVGVGAEAGTARHREAAVDRVGARPVEALGQPDLDPLEHRGVRERGDRVDGRQEPRAEARRVR